VLGSLPSGRFQGIPKADSLFIYHGIQIWYWQVIVEEVCRLHPTPCYVSFDRAVAIKWWLGSVFNVGVLLWLVLLPVAHGVPSYVDITASWLRSQAPAGTGFRSRQGCLR